MKRAALLLAVLLLSGCESPSPADELSRLGSTVEELGRDLDQDAAG